MNGGSGATNGACSAVRRRILGASAETRGRGAEWTSPWESCLGMVLAASLAAGWRLIRPQRVLDPGGAAMQRAVHAATTILPHLRRGLTPDSAASAAPPLRILTGGDAVALAGPDALLVFDGPGADHHAAGDPLDTLVPARREDRIHVEPRLACAEPGCPLRSAIVAPLAVRGTRVGALVALYERPGRVRVEESRVVAEAAALVSAMVELSELEAQGERLARADLAAFHLQRARRRRGVHPLPPGRGTRAADRVRRLHPLRVRPPAALRHAGR
jgi:GAF domain-containing protein